MHSTFTTPCRSSEVHELQSQLTLLSAKKENLEKERITLVQHKDAAEQAVARMTQRLEIIEAERDALERKKERQNAQLTRERDALDKEKRQLQQQKAELEAQVTALTNTTHAAERKCEAASRDYQTAMRKGEILQEETTELEQECRRLLELVDSQAETMSQLQSRVQEREKVVTEKGSKAHLEELLRQARITETEYRIEIEQLRQSLSRVEQQLNCFKEESDRAREETVEELTTLRQAHAEATSTRDQLLMECDVLRSEMNELQRMLPAQHSSFALSGSLAAPQQEDDETEDEPTNTSGPLHSSELLGDSSTRTIYPPSTGLLRLLTQQRDHLLRERNEYRQRAEAAERDIDRLVGELANMGPLRDELAQSYSCISLYKAELLSLLEDLRSKILSEGGAWHPTTLSSFVMFFIFVTVCIYMILRS